MPTITLVLSLTLFIFTVLNILVMAYNTRLILQSAMFTPNQIFSTNYSYIDKDYPPQLPMHIDLVAMTIDESHRYGIHDGENWKSLFPPAHGYVGLGSNNRLFAISMYHQLHCLNTLRVAFTRNSNSDYEHVTHCLDYLRQAILCHADTTLEESEVARRVDGVLDSGATGLGVTHTCRDWTQIRNFVEQNYKQRMET